MYAAAIKHWALFTHIETLAADTKLGRVLDAGTGPRSFRWLRSLDTESITAVTGDVGMQNKVEALIVEEPRPQHRLLLGNWEDPKFLADETFDTVLADYLLGAIEGFAPYFQDRLFARLRPLTGKRLYLTGVEPYVVHRPADRAGRLIWRIGRYRDACLLLMGGKPYREYPLDWVLEALRSAGFRPLATRKFPASHSAHFVNGQIDLIQSKLDKLPDKALAAALRRQALGHLESEGALNLGFSYVVSAEPA